MNFNAISSIKNDFVRKAIAQAIILKAEGLVQWQSRKLGELQAQIGEIVGDGESGSEVISSKLDRLCELYERFDADKRELVAFYNEAKASFHEEFGALDGAPAKASSDAVARARAIVGKREAAPF